jgi:hypothetical protein
MPLGQLEKLRPSREGAWQEEGKAAKKEHSEEQILRALRQAEGGAGSESHLAHETKLLPSHLQARLNASTVVVLKEDAAKRQRTSD